jgi:hypothetical protein
MARGWGLTTSQRDGGSEWRKSSHSGGQSECLEVCTVHEAVQVRHSKEQDGPVMRFSQAEWRAFLAAVRSREFDT